MKPIEIEIDEDLFSVINENKEIQTIGVSEFFRRAAKFFLKWKTEYDIDKQYEQAYGDPKVREAFNREMKEWMEEQVWIE